MGEGLGPGVSPFEPVDALEPEGVRDTGDDCGELLDRKSPPVLRVDGVPEATPGSIRPEEQALAAKTRTATTIPV